MCMWLEIRFTSFPTNPQSLNHIGPTASVWKVPKTSSKPRLANFFEKKKGWKKHKKIRSKTNAWGTLELVYPVVLLNLPMGLLTFWLFPGHFQHFCCFSDQIGCTNTATEYQYQWHYHETVDINKNILPFSHHISSVCERLNHLEISEARTDWRLWAECWGCVCGRLLVKCYKFMVISSRRRRKCWGKKFKVTKTFITDICDRTATSKWSNWRGQVHFGSGPQLVMRC